MATKLQKQAHKSEPAVEPSDKLNVQGYWRKEGCGQVIWHHAPARKETQRTVPHEPGQQYQLPALDLFTLGNVGTVYK